MEKQRNFTNSESGKRLLILILIFQIFITKSFGDTKRLTSAMIKDLTLKPVENQKLYINTDIKFELLIPYVGPGNVQINSQDYGQDVEFKTLRKTEFTDGEGGTKIEIWFSFLKKGTYTIKPLSLVIQGTKRSIRFQTVEITDNPKNISPKMVIVFSNEKSVSSESKAGNVLFKTTTGKKLSFTVYLQHAVQMLQFNWDIPKNSILTKTKDFEIKEVKYRENTYSEKLIPVASFEWTILTEGKNLIPSVTVSVIAYNGTRCELSVPFTYIETSGIEKSLEQEKQDYEDIFDLAFTVNKDLEEALGTDLSVEECRILAELRSKEKNNLTLSSKPRQLRKKFEYEKKLSGTANEFPAVYVLITTLALVIILISIIFFIKYRNCPLLIILVPLFVIVLILQVISCVKNSRKYGICAGCTVYSIPEKSAASKQEINPGSRVQILEKTGDWTYIQFGEIGAWCESSSIFFIE